MIHAQAAQIAIQIHDELAPFCEKICIAGSVRRGKPEVHDIELVLKPKLNPAPLIFQHDYHLLDYLDHPLGYLACARKLKGQSKYQQWQLPEIKLELYIVTPPAQYGVILALRTGPAELSQLLVTQRRKGGYLPSYARVQDGAVWVDGEAVDMPDEVNFFEFCALPYLRPPERDEFLVQRQEKWR